MRLRLLLLALALAGCVLGPDTAPPGPGDDDADVTLVQDPHPPVHPDVECPTVRNETALPKGGVAAPVWRAGQWWNYSMLDEDGRERGHALYEVEGCARLPDVLAYRVRETLREWGHPAGVREQPTVRERFFDVATLHTVWDGCGGPWYSRSPCKGRVPEWDFPLWPGKNWSYACCSDVPVTMQARAERVGDALWRIDTLGNGHPSQDWTYDAAAGIFVERGGGWGNGPGGWRLVGHGEGGPPAAPWRSAPRVELDPACVPGDARGPFDAAPVRQPWEASPEGLMTRLALALGEEPSGEPWRSAETTILRWNTTNGTIRASLDGDPREPLVLVYEGPADPAARSPAGLEAWVRGVLERFAFLDAHGVQVKAERSPSGVTASWRQEVAGRPVLGSGGSVITSQRAEWVWGPLFLLPDDLPVREEDARASAEAYAACRHTASGLGSAAFATAPDVPLAVVRGSLTYRFHVLRDDHGTGGHGCSGDWIHVDSQTGAILGREPPPCF